MKTIKEQVGGRPLSAVTPEKLMDPSSRPLVEGKAQPWVASVSPEATMNCIVEAWRVLPEETREELKRLLIDSNKNNVPGGGIAGGLARSLRPMNGYTYSKPEPLARAPDNVFVFRGKSGEVLGWRNVFDLPIEYDVELCPGLLQPDSATLSCRFLPDGGPRRRFIVIDEAVENLYGAKMSANFSNHGVVVQRLVLPGEEVSPPMVS
eukprot:jgi/Undpi1/6731/HiC_scaffold_20.g09210.m1